MTKQKWKVIKKNLPKNWAQEVSKSLTEAGLSISARNISDVKRGKVKDPVIVKSVFKEIKKLSSKHKRRKNDLKNLL